MSAIEWKPATPLELSELLTENFRGPRQSVLPIGGGTSLQMQAETAASVQLHTTGLQRVVDYPARDMTITVEAGMRVANLQAILSQERQQLPLDLPQGSEATIGGAIACNTSGPGQYGFGTFRDYVLGVSAVDGQGRLFSAGGRVVKNVAGYDLCKLLIGSRGTLGVMTQVTLKLVPQPQSRTFILLGSGDLPAMEEALARLNLSATRPVVLDLLNAAAIERLDVTASLRIPRDPYVLCIGYAGTSAETDWQADTVIKELQPLSFTAPCRLESDQARELWDALTEFQVSTAAELSFQASLFPSQVISMLGQITGARFPFQAHAGNGVIVGHLPPVADNSQAATASLQMIQKHVNANRGEFMLTNGRVDSFPTETVNPATPAADLMRQLKHTFDPAGLLHPGCTQFPFSIPSAS